MVEDGKRFIPTGHEPGNARYEFHFNHDYLDGFGPKVVDALLTSGMFALKEPKKRARLDSKYP